MFGAEGDSGAFSCIRSDGTTILNVLDPPAQPWVTSVGGTSFETFNPDANPNPSYPAGVETVWNFLNLCNSTSVNEDGLTGFDWCADDGAGGGGNSQYWGRPLYQFGPGLINAHTTYGNGTTQCSLAKLGTPCREVPDVSANADENTPYAEYCTGTPALPSAYAPASVGKKIPRLVRHRRHEPVIAPLVGDHCRPRWLLARPHGQCEPASVLAVHFDSRGFFNDITGIGQTTNNNGLFATTPGYDLATGVGTPKMGALITGFPEP